MLTFRQLLEKLSSTEPTNVFANGVGEAKRKTAWKDTWILMDIKVDIN